MGKAISDLTAASDVAEADMFELSQSLVSKKLTKQIFRRKLFSDPAYSFPSPINGDSLVFDGTDWIPGARGGWRVVPQAAYSSAAVGALNQINFIGGSDSGGVQMDASDYCSVGLPVRVVISGTTYYGMCTSAGTTTLVIVGASLPLATAITSVSIGTQEMIKHIDLRYPTTTYNTFGAAVNLPRGCNHRWRGKQGFLVAASCAHMNTSSTTVVNFKMNGGSNVLTTGIIPAAGTATTQGNFTDVTAGDIINANCAISDGQNITVVVPTAGGTADHLIACLTFVVP